MLFHVSRDSPRRHPFAWAISLSESLAKSPNFLTKRQLLEIQVLVSKRRGGSTPLGRTFPSLQRWGHRHSGLCFFHSRRAAQNPSKRPKENSPEPRRITKKLSLIKNRIRPPQPMPHLRDETGDR